jgi:hypothetical protein
VRFAEADSAFRALVRFRPVLHVIVGEDSSRPAPSVNCPENTTPAPQFGRREPGQDESNREA